MKTNCPSFPLLFKSFLLAALMTASCFLGACSTNPATGRTQFAALMSPAQENSVGAQEHEKIGRAYGFYDDPALLSYVRTVGRKVSAETERPDVDYKFFILDSPIVNAFALPGGYVYVSRGLLALANSEAELAAVLGHEVGHITARHSAERYSHGVVTSLGAAVLSAALENDLATQALGVGGDLYLKSYSRDQENEADTIGLRYMARGGYDPLGMPAFLQALQRESALQAQLSGKSAPASYFSTHPATADRVAKTRQEAAQYPAAGAKDRDVYLSKIDGLVYGDSAQQGLIRGQSFYHPALGFAFDVPPGFTLINQPEQVVATSPGGAVVLFDLARAGGIGDPRQYIAQGWMKGQAVQALESITVNGMPAAAALFNGKVGGRAMVIRLIAIRWKDNQYARFQIAIPPQAAPALVDSLKAATYSFRAMSTTEKAQAKPYRLKIVTAAAGDSVDSLATRQPLEDLPAEQFRMLNGLGPQDSIQPGRRYKLVVE